MFTYFAWRAGYLIGRLWRGLHNLITHSWESVVYDPIILALRLELANIKNARPNPIVVLMVWVIIHYGLQGELEISDLLVDLAINIIASYLYDR